MAPERALVHVEDDRRHFRCHKCIVWQLVKELKNFEDIGHVELLRTTKAVVRRIGKAPIVVRRERPTEADNQSGLFIGLLFVNEISLRRGGRLKLYWSGAPFAAASCSSFWADTRP
jgi:hypothetical protein